MSIDYSDMAFPKPGKKKKRKIHKKSILNSQKGICYLCARLNGDYSVKQTEEHHILFGAGQRAIDTVKILSVATLHDEFGFGTQRCDRFIKRFNKKAECIMDDMASWNDYIKMIKEELGIELGIRANK